MAGPEVPPELAALLAAMREELAHPLVAAARAGDLEAVERELPAADADYRGLALEEAAAHAPMPVIERLLAVVPITAPPLQRAIYRKRRDVLARLLATHPPADAVSIAFFSAVLDDDHESVDVFIDAGMLPDDARASVVRAGSDGMRKRFGVRKRRRRS